MIVPPVPHTAPIQNPAGRVAPVWSDFFKKIWERIGGADFVTLREAVPPGIVWEYCGTTAPTGFLMCDGSAVSRTLYADLFAVIGTTYGAGDGSTTFNLPTRGGRFAVGKATSGTFSTLGATGGAESATLPNHVHSVSLTTSGPSSTTDVHVTGVLVASLDHTHQVTGNTGNPTTNPGFAILPPYIVQNYIIKT